MDWNNLLHTLHTLVLNVKNRSAADEGILGCRELDLSYTDDHWEAINPIMNDVLGWGGQSAKGYLSEQSSQADFLAIHSFFLEFCRFESGIKQCSCFGAMMPRIEKAIRLW